MKKWKILKVEDISPSKWFPIQKHTVKLPNNKIVDDFYVSRLGKVAMVLPITENNEVVFVEQYKHGIGEVMIELPAGFMQKGKTIEGSALAELEEETGIKITKRDLISLGKISVNPTKSDHVTYSFLAKNLKFNSKQKFDENEDIKLRRIKPKKAIEMIIQGKIWAADTTISILKAARMFPELFR